MRSLCSLIRRLLNADQRRMMKFQIQARIESAEEVENKLERQLRTISHMEDMLPKSYGIPSHVIEQAHSTYLRWAQRKLTKQGQIDERKTDGHVRLTTCMSVTHKAYGYEIEV